MPASTSCAEPPFASAAAKTPAMAEPDWSGLPLRATLPLYSGFSKSLKLLGGLLMRFWL